MAVSVGLLVAVADVGSPTVGVACSGAETGAASGRVGFGSEVLGSVGVGVAGRVVV